MKNLRTGMICLMFILGCVTADAQSDLVREPDHKKPSLFHQLPQRVNCRLNNLQSLLHAKTGQQINIAIADNLDFEGIVASVANKENGRISSVVIRSTNFEGAALTFSKLIKEDGGIQYAGRIISFQHNDAFEIQFENGQYVLIKKGFYDLVNE